MRKLLCILLLLFPLFVQAQTIHISTPHDTVCNGFPEVFTATETGSLSPYYNWTVNGISISGAFSSLFIRDSLHNGDSVLCLLTNSTHDTIIARSNSIVMTVQLPPFAGTITGADTFVCVGTTITLSDTTAGGIWSAGNNYVSVSGGVVTGLRGEPTEFTDIPGQTAIYYIVSDQCGPDTAVRIITVMPQPNAGFYLGSPFSYGANELCVGGRLLVDGGDGSMPLHATYGYVLADAYGVYGVSAGTDYVYCTITKVCGSDSHSVRVTVDSAPAPLRPVFASSLNVCVGSTVKLYDSSSGYWYTSNNKASVDPHTGIVTGQLPGIASISLVAENQCGSKSSSIAITIDPPEPIIGVDSFCQGETVVFFDSTKGGIWSSGNTFIATIDQSGILKGLLWGYAVISYTLPSSGCVTTWETAVNPNFLPTPITGISDFCLKGTTYLSEETSGGKWTTGNSKIASVDVTGGVSGLTVGAATITYSLKGCIETKDVSVSVCKDEMNIYPNPSHDEVTIYAFDNIYNTYSFVNVVGRTALQGTLVGPFTKVDIQLLPSGFYTIILLGAQDRYISKFVKD